MERAGAAKDADYSQLALSRWRKWALRMTVVMWGLIAVLVWLAYGDWPPPVLYALRGGIELLLHGMVAGMMVWYAIVMFGITKVERRNGQWVNAEARPPVGSRDRGRWVRLNVGVLCLLWLPWGVSQFVSARLFDGY